MTAEPGSNQKQSLPYISPGEKHFFRGNRDEFNSSGSSYFCLVIALTKIAKCWISTGWYIGEMLART
jgi:hypothetical protein